jgi:hypothetical protein
MNRIGQQQRFSPIYKAEAVVNQTKFSLNQGRQVAIVIPFWNSLSVTGVYNDPETRHPSLSEELIKQFEKIGIKREEISLIYGKNLIEQNVKDFQSGKKRVAILTVETGGTGIDLDDQVGDARRDVIIVSPPWAGDAMDQVIHRFSRRNTKSPTRMLLMWITRSMSDLKKKDVWDKKRQVVRTIQAGEDPSDVEAAAWDPDLEFGQGEITEPVDPEVDLDDNVVNSPSRWTEHDTISNLDVNADPGDPIPKWKQWLFGKPGAFNFGQEMIDALRRAGVPSGNISHLRKRYLGMYYGASETIRLQTSLNAFTAIHEGMHWATLSNKSKNAAGLTVVDDILTNGTAQDMKDLRDIVSAYYGAPGPVLKNARSTVVEGACLYHGAIIEHP